ncbi:ribosome small subunit-dependent GTPase A [Aestuariimicrobium sp. Y1814]|uniref:ribosome small subunit-dependent GTPase A n=1 Tax=Aestuariimicrobium sp. Y1814 TaxID=3418742 RepID=UPI003DA77E12
MSPKVRGVASRSFRDDDTDAFDRPRRTRPRTKDRPDFSGLPLGRVVTIDRGRYTCTLLDDDVQVVAAKARNLGRKAAIVGDVVHLDGDVSGREGTLARIVEVAERSTVLRRTADDDDPHERPIVANADQLMIVTALADPPPRVGMIDRILVAAFDAGIAPILCLTKADLASPDELVAAYEPLDVPVVVTEPGADLARVRDLLAGHVTVLVGHSGVGKSTLVNALIPTAGRSVGVVNETTGRGRHTSTSAIALELPSGPDEPTGGGWAIDTPGVRSFGLSHVTPETVLAAFPDLVAYTAECPRGCQHTSTEPECGLDAAAGRGELPQARLESFRRMERAGREEAGRDR